MKGLRNGALVTETPDGVAAKYIRENFQPSDCLAIVLLNKRRDKVSQRIATAEKIAAEDFQRWLRAHNANGYEIYVSMNALHSNATGRTKSDVEAIRHVYLDFDDQGTAAVERLLARQDLPQLNYLINTSPDKWQVVWKVQGFGKEQVEHLQRALARETGADPAATDCARVLRVPGFYNHKYGKPFLVASQSCATETYRPDRFPQFPEERGLHSATRRNGLSKNNAATPEHLSQSERDWAYARRALMRGDREADVIEAIAVYRRYDKHNPRYYAALTVQKAAESLRAEISRPAVANAPDR